MLPLFPRAPELVIIVTGPPNGLGSTIASAISLVVSCQTPTTCS